MSDSAKAVRYRRYLLGQLPDGERDAVEESYFGTDEGLAGLQDAEEELIDAYESGVLPADDRVRFEERYLRSSEGTRRLAIERELTRVARRRAPADPVSRRSARIKWLAWAAGLLLAAHAITLLLWQRHLQEELGQASSRNDALGRQAERQERRIEEQESRLAAMRDELQRLRDRAETLETLALDPGPATRLVSLLLRPGLKRDLEPLPELRLPPDARVAGIVLAFEAAVEGPYRASIQTAEGREVWSRSRLLASRKGTGRSVSLTVPAGVLQPGHYVVVLAEDRERSSALAEYVFRVPRP